MPRHERAHVCQCRDATQSANVPGTWLDDRGAGIRHACLSRHRQGTHGGAGWHRSGRGGSVTRRSSGQFAAVEGTQRTGHRRSYAGTARSGTLSDESFDGQDGLCHRRTGAGHGREGDAGVRTGFASGAAWRRCRQRAERPGDVPGRAGCVCECRHHHHGRGRWRLPSGRAVRRENQEKRTRAHYA